MLPKGWILDEVGVYIGHWLGHFKEYWTNLVAFVKNGASVMEPMFFRLAKHMPSALGQALPMIIGGPGSAETSLHAVNRVRGNLD